MQRLTEMASKLAERTMRRSLVAGAAFRQRKRARAVPCWRRVHMISPPNWREAMAEEYSGQMRP